MGGICGIVSRDLQEVIGVADIASMMRGLNASSDDESESVALSAPRVGLGAQPFPGRLSGVSKLVHGINALGLAFHGSVYNMDELTVRADHHSDPIRKLLCMYVEQGIEFVRCVRGEFALAIWDGERETLYLATDRFRVHPIFYYYGEQKLVFASTMKAIVGGQARPPTLTVNPEAVIDVVGSSMIPTPDTIFKEIKKLAPGHILTYRSGTVHLKQYWDIDFTDQQNSSEFQLAQELRSVFMNALAIRLRQENDAQVVGTFLSGGVDSSTVTGVLTQLVKKPIKCFSIGFGEQQFNEIKYARIATQAFGAKHYEYFVTPDDVYRVIPILLNSCDEPFANASAVPTYFCATLARQHGAEVLYAGDGGDELFAGNERYATQRLFDYYQEIPTWLRNSVLTPTVFALADLLKMGLLTSGKKYIQRSSIPYPERLYSYGFLKNISMTDWFNEELLRCLGDDFIPYAATNLHYFQAKAHSALDRQLYVDLKLTISDNDLVKVTRMTEAAGVAVRYPFLDHHVAEFAAKVPARMKMRGRQLRSFFKKAYADLLPREIRVKQKHGFGLPIPVWLRTDGRLSEMMHDLVLSPRSLQRGYFRRKALEELVRQHQTEESPFYGTILWNLMILELWHRTYVDSGATVKSPTGRQLLWDPHQPAA